MEWYKLVVGVLSVWRLTHLLQAEDGPWDIFVSLRRIVGNGFWGKLLDCFYCLSMWVAAPFAYYLALTWPERGMLWLALSGAAILLERATAHPETIPPALYYEEKSTEQEE